MCGIVGVLGAHDKIDIEAMLAKIEQRGPDKSNVYKSDNYSTGVSHLFFKDRNAVQPLQYGKYRLSYNGEIYNYKSLEDDFKKNTNLQFEYDSDTELILKGFALNGFSFFDTLEGMFAMGIHCDNDDENQLILARDSVGIKPLYYYIDPSKKCILYASEIKALVSNCVDLNIDTSAVVENHVFGFTIGDKTFFKEIKQIQPGQILVFSLKDGIVNEEKDLRINYKPQVILSEKEIASPKGIKQLLLNAIENTISDSDNIGILLSGGVDSVLLTGLTKQYFGEKKIHTFTFTDNLNKEDVKYSKQISEYFQTDHKEIKLDQLSEFDLLESIYAHELPVGLTSLIQAGRQIKKYSRALLSGEGADELFWGYHLYRHTDQLISIFHKKLFLLQKSRLFFDDAFESSKQLLKSISSTSSNLETTKTGTRNKLYEIYLTSQLVNKQLLFADRGSMYNGLELRVPFLNQNIWQHSKLYAGNSLFFNKVILRDLVKECVPNKLGIEIAERKKSSANMAIRKSNLLLGKHLEENIDSAYLKNHKIRPLVSNAFSMAVFDFFMYIFIVKRGEMPKNFNIQSLYSEHYDDLMDAYQCIDIRN